MRNESGPSKKKVPKRKANSPRKQIVRAISRAETADSSYLRPLDQRLSLRDDLISKARDGAITADEAEKQARDAGVGPLASRPDPAEFDPMKESRWTMLQTIAWIAWRDDALVMDQNPEYRKSCIEWIFRPWSAPEGTKFVRHEGWFLESSPPPRLIRLNFQNPPRRSESEPSALSHLTPGMAEAELWKALQADSLKAEAFDKAGCVVEIPVREWAYLKVYEERDKQVLKHGPLDVQEFTEMRFKRLDVLSIWPRSHYVPINLDTVDLGNITQQHFGLMLSGDAYVPFSVAVCWIATKSGLKTVSMRDETEWKCAAKVMLSHVSATHIGIIGCGDDAESRPLPATAFDSIDCPHPCSTNIGYLLGERTFVRSVFYLGDEDWKRGYDDQFFMQGKRRPHWTRLRVHRKQVLDNFPEPPPTANLETACFKWLLELMKVHKFRPKPKRDLLEEARAKFPGLGVNQSERAWTKAVRDGSGEWSRRGPIAKD